jgi:hypothetical protein
MPFLSGTAEVATVAPRSSSAIEEIIFKFMIVDFDIELCGEHHLCGALRIYMFKLLH